MVSLESPQSVASLAAGDGLYAPDKLADLVDFIALRFAQQRPEGDPSEIVERLVKAYAYQKSPVYTRLVKLSDRFSDEHASTVIDSAFMSNDGIIDGQLEQQRASKELEDLTKLEEKMMGPGREHNPIAVAVQQRMTTIRRGVELSRAHFNLMAWVNSNSTDDVDGPQHRATTLSTPWREVDVEPGLQLVQSCLDATMALDAEGASDVIVRCRGLNAIRRDVARVRRSLALIPYLKDVGRDPSLAPASTFWVKLLRLPAFEYEHQQVAAIREAHVQRYCLMRVVQLMNESDEVRDSIVDFKQVEEAREAERRAADAAAAAAAEKKRAEEERRSATAASGAARRGKGAPGRDV
jgi:hypothetical protein